MINSKGVKRVLVIFLIFINVIFFSSCCNIDSDEENVFEIKVGTLNIGHFSNGTSYEPNGDYSSFDNYYGLFKKINVDILFIQENSSYFDVKQTVSSDCLYADYPYRFFGEQYYYNCNGILSKYPINTNYSHLFSIGYQKRYFLDCEINIYDDKVIHCICTQLDWEDNNTRYSQIDELIEYISSLESFILAGDMNPSNRNSYERIDGSNYFDLLTYQKFIDNGYNLAHGPLNFLNTIVDKCFYPWDNIITSKNITIEETNVNNIIVSDHLPVVSRLRLKI